MRIFIKGVGEVIEIKNSDSYSDLIFCYERKWSIMAGASELALIF